jgi:hypothetical protein
VKGSENWIVAARDLPAGPFTLAQIALSDRGTKVTDAGLERLKAVKGLRRLHLSGTAVTDAGLAHLAGLKGLRHLYLGHTAIGDDGLEHLAGLPVLTGLQLHGTKVTADGVAKLQKALPKCKIEFDPPKK